jgi:Protein of unknown function (DUF3105)
MGRRRVGSGRRLPVGALMVGGILLAVLIAFIAVVVISVRQQAPSTPPEGVKTFHNLSRRHTEGPVNYPQTPPVGGPHSPVWQNCGFYSEPVRNENAVHSMEHGAVWITYRPDLPQEQVDKLRELAESQSYVLVSPYPGLPSPVVASAWGKQLRLDSANNPRLEQFIRAYRQGPQTPEPGAPCSGGVAQPE